MIIKINATFLGFILFSGYKWSDGSAFVYANWFPGEPNDFHSNEDCVTLNKQAQKWNDNNCYTARSFICQIRRGNALYTNNTATATTTVIPIPRNNLKCTKSIEIALVIFILLGRRMRCAKPLIEHFTKL